MPSEAMLPPLPEIQAGAGPLGSGGGRREEWIPWLSGRLHTVGLARPESPSVSGSVSPAAAGGVHSLLSASGAEASDGHPSRTPVPAGGIAG